MVPDRRGADEVPAPDAGHGVCGALGSWPTEVYARLCARMDVGPVPRLEAAHAVIHARSPLRHWANEGREGVAWGPAVRPRGPVRGWKDVADGWQAAGLEIGPGPADAVLHNNEAGTCPIYYHLGEGFALFATSLDALARSLGGRLHVDRGAWAELLSSGGVLGSSTPFEEIRRLAPDEVLDACSRPRRSGREWRWNDIEESSRVEPGAVIDAFEEAVRGVDGDHLLVPLSGGWDSRLLAGIASTIESADVRTITVQEQFARDEETRWAVEVARRLHLPHEELPRSDDWWRDASWMAEATAHQTSRHHWLAPLVRRLEGTHGTVLDGLGGDVLLRNLYVPDDVIDADPEDQTEILTRKICPPLADGGLVNDDLAAAMDHHARQHVIHEYRHLSSHPAQLELVGYRLRTLGYVVLAPSQVYVRHAAVAMPFTDPGVVQQLLGVSTRDKRGGNAYGQVLAALGHGLDATPSTNDTTPRWRGRAQPDLAPSVIASTLEWLQHPALEGAHGPVLRNRLATGRLVDLLRTNSVRDVVRGLVLFARWVEKYDDVLGPDRRLHEPRPSPRGRSVGREVLAGPAGRRYQPTWIEAQLDVGDLIVRQSKAKSTASSDRPWVAELVAGSSGSAAAEVEGTSADPRAATVSAVGLDGIVHSPADAEAALELCRRHLPHGGRIAIALRLAPAQGSHQTLLEPTATLEQLASGLDIIHWECSSGALRLVGRLVESGAGRLDPTQTVALLGAVLSEMSTGFGNLALELRKLHEELDAQCGGPAPD